MLEAQVVVNLLLELEVRVDFVGHGTGSVKAQTAGRQRRPSKPPHTGAKRTGFSVRSPSVLAHYCTLTWIGFGLFATALFGK